MPSERKGPAVATEYVTLRHPKTLVERTVAKSAVKFFPDYEVLDKSGRKAAHQPTTTEKKD